MVRRNSNTNVSKQPSLSRPTAGKPRDYHQTSVYVSLIPYRELRSSASPVTSVQLPQQRQFVTTEST